MTIQDSKILRMNPIVFTYYKENAQVDNAERKRERERVTKPGLAGNANQST